MLTKTKYFGEIDLDEKKIITFEEGILGFAEYKRWTILYDIDEKENSISWLQSLDEAGLALPIVNPFSIIAEYNPLINDDYLVGLGDFTEENLIVLNTLTVPQNVQDTTANLKAPFIINTENNKGVQVIVEGDEFPVKYRVYEAVQKMKKEKGEM